MPSETLLLLFELHVSRECTLFVTIMMHCGIDCMCFVLFSMCSSPCGAKLSSFLGLVDFFYFKYLIGLCLFCIQNIHFYCISICIRIYICISICICICIVSIFVYVFLFLMLFFNMAFSLPRSISHLYQAIQKDKKERQWKHHQQQQLNKIDLHTHKHAQSDTDSDTATATDIETETATETESDSIESAGNQTNKKKTIMCMQLARRLECRKSTRRIPMTSPAAAAPPPPPQQQLHQLRLAGCGIGKHAAKWVAQFITHNFAHIKVIDMAGNDLRAHVEEIVRALKAEKQTLTAHLDPLSTIIEVLVRDDDNDEQQKNIEHNETEKTHAHIISDDDEWMNMKNRPMAHKIRQLWAVAMHAQNLQVLRTIDPEMYKDVRKVRVGAKISNLKHLNVSRNNLNDEDFAVIAELLPDSALKSLIIGTYVQNENNRLNEHGSMALANALANPLTTLSKLSMPNTGFIGTHHIAKALHSAVSYSPLTLLDVRGLAMNDDTFYTLCIALSKMQKIRKVYLARNPFGARGARGLLSLLKNSSKLKILDLSFCMISTNTKVPGSGGSSFIEQLFYAIASNKSSALNTIMLDGNTLDMNGSQQLHSALNYSKCPSIRFISLADCKLRDISYLALGLSNNQTLRRLDLSNNAIGDEGAVCLSLALQGRLNCDSHGTLVYGERGQPVSTLRTLVLERCSIADIGLDWLSQAIALNYSLRRLFFASNAATDDAGEHLLHTINSIPKELLVVTKLDIRDNCTASKLQSQIDAVLFDNYRRIELDGLQSRLTSVTLGRSFSTGSNELVRNLHEYVQTQIKLDEHTSCLFEELKLMRESPDTERDSLLTKLKELHDYEFAIESEIKQIDSQIQPLSGVYLSRVADDITLVNERYELEQYMRNQAMDALQLFRIKKENEAQRLDNLEEYLRQQLQRQLGDRDEAHFLLKRTLAEQKSEEHRILLAYLRSSFVEARQQHNAAKATALNSMKRTSSLRRSQFQSDNLYLRSAGRRAEERPSSNDIATLNSESPKRIKGRPVTAVSR